MKMRIHINKHELKKGKKGKPWTIHTSGKCIRAKDITIKGTTRADCELQRKSNPKCFIIVEGTYKHLGGGRYLVTSTN